MSRSSSYLSSSCPPVVIKPNNPAQVIQARHNFLSIARREREDSRERDKNFMPEVRCDHHLIVPKDVSVGNSLVISNQNSATQNQDQSMTHHNDGSVAVAAAAEQRAAQNYQ